MSDETTASPEACRELLDHVLRDERAWLDELAPGGDPNSALAGLIDRGPEAYRSRPLRVRWLSFLGEVLWDVFSNNNDVVGPSGERYDLGSFRGTGRFLADHLNDRLAAEAGPTPTGRARGPFDYIDFYMGTWGLFLDGDEPGLPFYARVFERLWERGCDWRFAATGLTDPPGDQAPADDPPLFTRADGEPPAIVRAYRDEYGRWPARAQR